MLREEVISQWNGLKTKVNSLKLSEKNKQTIKFLGKCSLNVFYPGGVEDYELDDWEIRAREVQDQLELLDPDNEQIVNWWCLADQYTATLLDWIQLRKIKKEHQFQLSEIYAFLTRADVVDMAQINSFEEVMRELKRLDNFWEKISNWDNSLATSENNPNLKFAIVEDESGEPYIEEYD